MDLQNVDDFVIWQYAKDKGFVIVSQDSDFNDLSVLKGFPPFVVWIKSGNIRVSDIELLLRTHSIRLREFLDNESLGLIELE